MVDVDYEKDYLERKKKSRRIYEKLIATKDNQRIYHELVGSRDVEDNHRA